jgi:hypothetical protein
MTDSSQRTLPDVTENSTEPALPVWQRAKIQEVLRSSHGEQ